MLRQHKARDERRRAILPAGGSLQPRALSMRPEGQLCAWKPAPCGRRCEGQA
ncbi:MAG TPA: hypothetical protein VGF67_25545 [Ktedonobacteraceae bacterium]